MSFNIDFEQSFQNIKNFKFNIFLKKQNKVLMSFLDGIKDNTGSENLIAKCVAMEQIYSLNNPAL